MIEKANLTTEEIERLIAEKEKELDELFSPEFFVLNDKYEEIQKEICKLQTLCSHEVQDGHCIHCHIPEELIK